MEGGRPEYKQLYTEREREHAEEQGRTTTRELKEKKMRLTVSVCLWDHERKKMRERERRRKGGKEKREGWEGLRRAAVASGMAGLGFPGDAGRTRGDRMLQAWGKEDMS